MAITKAPPSDGGILSATGTALSPLALLDILHDYVHESAAVLPVAGPGLTARTYELLELGDELEIWAIHWPKDQALQLHDHGGSGGAIWVVAGSLEEHYVTPERTLARRSIVGGGGVAFGRHYVHDVVNIDDVVATSVHAYSPPMASMTFYRHTRSGPVAERAEYRADPSWAP